MYNYVGTAMVLKEILGESEVTLTVYSFLFQSSPKGISTDFRETGRDTDVREKQQLVASYKHPN